MMLTFWLLVAAMLAVALGLLLPTLLKGRGAIQDSSESHDVALARERLRELQQALAAGQLTRDEFEQARQGEEQRLADELQIQPPQKASGASGRGLSVVVLLLIPLVAIGLYRQLGSPDSLQQQAGRTTTAMPAGHPGAAGGLASVDEMVGRLADRLRQNPEDVDGWRLLVRSLMSLNRYDDAARAYPFLLQLTGDDPDVLVGYADVLALTQNGRIQGKPMTLVEQALSIQPDHPTALWLQGIGLREQGRYADAITAWQKARSLLSDEPAAQSELDGLIASARAQATDAESVAVPAAKADGKGASVQVTVELDPALAPSVRPDDTVFILAKALSGPPMPLAVLRQKVSDLPLTVTLDDSLAMMPALRLSAFPEVSVVARLSRSGNPLSQPGDIEAKVSPVRPAQQPAVHLRITAVEP